MMTGNVTNFNLSYPRIGTCCEPVDQLQISVSRVRVIPDLIVGFDGERGGWSIGGSFPRDDEFEFRELAFIPELLFNEKINDIYVNDFVVDNKNLN